MLSGPKRTIRRARKLRGEMTLPEVLLWRVLRTRPNGLKFRRQHPGNQPQIDEQRDEYLRRNGYRVLRIPAVHVLSDLDAVVRQVVTTADESPLHYPSDGPPPLKGRI